MRPQLTLGLCISFSLAIAACTGLPSRPPMHDEPPLSPESPSDTPSILADSDVLPGSELESCTASPSSAAHPTDADVFGAGPGASWYCSPDLEICAVKGGEWFAGGWKVGWRKPAGSELVIQGRRLDAAAPLLGASIPDGYPGRFQSTALIFPTQGCWEIQASALESQVTFTVPVSPPHQEPRGGRCDTLEEVVKNSDAILIGTVEKSVPGPEGRYWWHDVQIYRAWKNPRVGDGLMFLQDTLESPALAVGHRYLLFLQRDPFQLHCPQGTLVEVINEELISLTGFQNQTLLWSDVSWLTLQKTVGQMVNSQ